VEPPGEDLLADPGLAEQQDAQRAPRRDAHRLEDLAHDGIGHDDVAVAFRRRRLIRDRENRRSPCEQADDGHRE
jgi:hypothetical protein